jgi:Rieske Fe-S protein
MSDQNNSDAAGPRADGRAHEPLRRQLLLWFSAAVFGSMFASVAAAAFKFLRPQADAAGDDDAAARWVAVANLSELSGAEPLRREVMVEQRAGWSTTTRAHAVYVLPTPSGQPRRVVSAACPHEGCEVEWSAERGQFLCPCHDSSFAADGARLGGPAERALALLPSRLRGDVLEIPAASAVKGAATDAAQVGA